jgi:GAF domain-containing protein
MTGYMSLLNQPERGQSIAVTPARFEQVEELCRQLYGFKLLTVLRRRPGIEEIERVYSSNPRDYPVGDQKPMGRTPWGAVVLDGGQAWLGNGTADLEWAFPDSKRLGQLGCRSCACSPILKDGKAIGVLSLSHEIDRYKVEDLEGISLIASILCNVIEPG